MSEIDVQNAKNIRDAMEVHIRVQATINGSTVTYDYSNEDIVSCELNLRSDLSPIDPTLPESEIVVRVYSEEDVSDIVKYIANDQPLTYWAGYNGAYSTVRKFYISEPVTWHDRIITFKAVDAVHFLNKPSARCLIYGSARYAVEGSTGYIRYYNFGVNSVNYTGTSSGVIPFIYRYIAGQITDAGVTISSRASNPSYGGSNMDTLSGFAILGGGDIRDVIADINNLAKIDLPSGAFTNNAVWFTYVDAGIPTLTSSKPTSKWTINEADCGDISKDTQRDIISITAKNASLLPIDYMKTNLLKNIKVGSISITKNVGGAVSLEQNCLFAYAIVDGNSDYFLEINTLQGVKGYVTHIQESGSDVGLKVFKESGYMPWDSKMSTFWNNAAAEGKADNTTGETTFDLYGAAIFETDEETSYTKSGSGEARTVNTKWVGNNYLKASSGGTVYRVFPNMAYTQLLNRSGVTGSFTWKGDPRMQPRDVFTFVYRDGTTELRTVETINLKHEGGGTVATITYRKGIV